MSDSREAGAARFMIEEGSLVATYFRVALLLGLVRGDVVHAWASDVVARTTQPSREMIDLLMVPEHDLSALRHALLPLGEDPMPPAVVHAVLGRVHADVVSGQRSWPDTVTVLDQLRSMERPPAELRDAIRAQVHAHLLASDGEPDAVAAAELAIAEWLQQFAENVAPEGA